MSDEITDQDIIDGEHDCREHIRTGDATQVDVHQDLNIQVEYECDECGRSVYEIYGLINIQIEQRDGTGIMEPGTDGSPWDGELYRR
jgi:hypothetical protein